MKLATISIDGTPTVVVVAGRGGLVPVAELDASAPATLGELLGADAGALNRLGELAAARTGTVDEASATFLPPVPEPHAVWCATLNYATHVEEGNWETTGYAGWFLRAADSLVGHGQPMLRPAISDRLDYEGELAVIIGTPGRDIDPADALDHVAGYSCFNDGSVRDWQRHSTQITPGKNFAATGGFGPYVVTPDEVPDIMRARLVTRLNGEVMQDAHISDMTTPVPELIAYLSTLGVLRTGDVVVTGTPGGVGARKTPPVFMKHGDVVEVEIDGLGTLRNPIVDVAPATGTASATATGPVAGRAT